MATKVVDRVTNTIQTTDVNPQFPISYTLPAGSTGAYTATIVAREPATDDSAGYILRGVWKRPAAGNAAVPGGGALVVDSAVREDQAAWDATCVLATFALQIQVTGENAKTIEWYCVLDVVYYTP